jgi:hypothetical protein
MEKYLGLLEVGPKIQLYVMFVLIYNPPKKFPPPRIMNLLILYPMLKLKITTERKPHIRHNCDSNRDSINKDRFTSYMKCISRGFSTTKLKSNMGITGAKN